MQRCDVLIVGGGPAGSTLAWKLRDSGLRVVVWDKKQFPRDKVCAGWITPAVVQALRLDLQDYAAGRVLQPVQGFRIGMLGGEGVETRYAEPVSYGIRRCEFDHYLLQRSATELHPGETFKGMVRSDNGWIVNDSWEARVVVGAGGHFCPVARALGAKLGSAETVVAAQEIEFEMTPTQQAQCSADAEVPELFFCEDLKGYGWVVRKGNYLNVGLGREDNRKLSEHVERFRAFLIAQGKIPPDTPAKFHGHAYLLYPHAPRRVYGDGVLLIGDAAGLAYAQSGEGIRPAVESALLAGDVILGAADFGRETLARYEQLLAARFGPRQPGHGLSDLLPAWLRQAVARRLLETHWFARRVVMDRWFLHVHQGALESA